MQCLSISAGLVSISLTLMSAAAIGAPPLYRVVDLKVDGIGGDAASKDIAGPWIAATYTQRGGGSSSARCRRNQPCARVAELPHPGGGQVAAGINRSGTLVGTEIHEIDARGFVSILGGSLQYIRTLNDDCPWLNHLSSSAEAVNNKGDIVGYSQDCDSYQGYVIRDGKMSLLPKPEDVQNLFPQDLNEHRTIVGRAWKADGTSEAFLYRAKETRLLGTLGGSFSEATAVNELGTVVGCSLTSGDTGKLAFIYQGDEMIALPPLGNERNCAHGINDSGDIVGSEQSAGKELGFVRWQGTTYFLDSLLLKQDRPNWTISDAAAINNNGEIAATAVDRHTGFSMAVRLVPVWAN